MQDSINKYSRHLNLELSCEYLWLIPGLFQKLSAPRIILNDTAGYYQLDYKRDLFRALMVTIEFSLFVEHRLDSAFNTITLALSTRGSEYFTTRDYELTMFSSNQTTLQWGGLTQRVSSISLPIQYYPRKNLKIQMIMIWKKIQL